MRSRPPPPFLAYALTEPTFGKEAMGENGGQLILINIDLDTPQMGHLSGASFSTVVPQT